MVEKVSKKVVEAMEETFEQMRRRRKFPKNILIKRNEAEEIEEDDTSSDVGEG